MFLKNACMCLVIAGGSSVALGTDGRMESKQEPVAKPVPAAATAESDAARAPAAGAPSPAIVVHTGAVSKDDRDGRVEVSGVRISVASWSPARPEAATTNGPALADKPITTAPAARTDGAIVMPDNTFGPGEPLWSIRDRENSARKVAQAEADVARAEAERAPWDSYGYSYPGYTGYGWLGGFGGIGTWGGYGHGHIGPRGPVTTTITRFDDLGSTAQRAYFDAAYPRLNGSQDAHDRAVSQFGRDATPPIVRIQNDVDRAHTNANKEHPKR